ncbi:MAG: hypothetical protein R3250_02100 [Melioribacteraceae bacterium]|nr:hypothetical protein [Melioribacteraceae bacterium]
MKLFFSLTVLFLSISLLLFQTNSFTKAEITSEARLSVVSEENSLIAVTYGVGKQFTITNNTRHTVEIEEVWLNGDSDNRIIEIRGKGNSVKSGGNKEFNITDDPNELPGKVIQLIVRWEGGNAVIKSTIPDENKNDKNVEEKDKEKVKEDKEQPELEKVEVPVVIEPVKPVVEENTTNLEIISEPVISIVEEAAEEQVDTEIDGEQSNPVETEDKK